MTLVRDPAENEFHITVGDPVRLKVRGYRVYQTLCGKQFRDTNTNVKRLLVDNLYSRCRECVRLWAARLGHVVEVKNSPL